MTKQHIISLFKNAGADKCGIAPARIYDELLPLLERRGFVPFVKPDYLKRINPYLYLKDAKSIIVCLFKYRDGEDKTVARYARGGDYHPYIKEKLKSACQNLPGKHKILVDSGSLPEKHIAYLAGLGYFGKNNLLYSEGLGSYFNIGLVLTDLEIEPDKPVDTTCQQCDRCVKACPGGALGDGFCLEAEKCASYLTQKEVPLTKEQKDILKHNPYTLGCDICADVCPLNKEK
ncbi:MAG: epoxyqueuosine reductase [Clostridia bacterium]|nr:epoxyqueuosine reductase [Clostridia bacterium]